MKQVQLDESRHPEFISGSHQKSHVISRLQKGETLKQVQLDDEYVYLSFLFRIFV